MGWVIFLVIAIPLLAVVVWMLMPEWTAAQPLANDVGTPRESVKFVQMTPLVETEAVAKQNVEHSDRDRRATAPTTAPVPANDAPPSVGNTIEKSVAAPPPEKPTGSDASAGPGAVAASTVPDLGARPPVEAPPQSTAKPAGSGLGQSIRNLQQYLDKQNFNNPQGGAVEPDTHIQFDSKGVEFGPWIRRFLLQLKRNWLAPPITMQGCSSIQFYVHRDGRISDIKVVRPSSIDPFNTSAHAALQRTSPTLPLPTEYPDDRILFTVTFIYNARTIEACR